jgi:hypothetical protein
VTCRVGKEGEQRYISFTLSLILARVGGRCLTPSPAALPAGKRRGTHYVGIWVGPRPVWTGAENLDFHLGFDPQTVRPVASRHPCPKPVAVKRKPLRRFSLLPCAVYFVHEASQQLIFRPWRRALRMHTQSTAVRHRDCRLYHGVIIPVADAVLLHYVQSVFKGRKRSLTGFAVVKHPQTVKYVCRYCGRM